MTTKRRRQYTANFKKRVALEALRGDRTVQAIPGGRRAGGGLRWRQSIARVGSRGDDRPLGASEARLGFRMDTDGVLSPSRSSPGCLKKACSANRLLPRAVKEALDDEDHSIAMEILAEAATEGVFARAARRRLGALYSVVTPDASGRIADTLDVLVHDGYLEASADGHRFASQLLRDWWAARFRDHHVPLASRGAGDA